MSKAKDIAQRLQGSGDSYARELQGQIDSLSDRAERTEEALNAEDPQRYEKLRKGAMGILQAVGKYADAVGKEEATVAGYDYEFERNKLVSDIGKMTPLDKAKAMAEGGALEKFHAKWEGKFDALGDKYKNQFLIGLHSDISKIGIDTEKSRIKQGLETFQASKMQMLQAEWAKGVTTGKWVGAKEFASKLSRLAASEFPGNDKAIKAARKAAMQGAAGEFLDGKLSSHVKSKDVQATKKLLETKGAEGIFEKSTIDAATALLTRSKTAEFKQESIAWGVTAINNKVDLNTVKLGFAKRGHLELARNIHKMQDFQSRNGIYPALGTLGMWSKDPVMKGNLNQLELAMHKRLKTDPGKIAKENGLVEGTREFYDVAKANFTVDTRTDYVTAIGANAASTKQIKQAHPEAKVHVMQAELGNHLLKERPKNWQHTYAKIYANLFSEETIKDVLSTNFTEIDNKTVSNIVNTDIVNRIASSMGMDGANAISMVQLHRANMQIYNEQGELDLNDPDKKSARYDDIKKRYNELMQQSSDRLLESHSFAYRPAYAGAFGTAIYPEKAYADTEDKIKTFELNMGRVTNLKLLETDNPLSPVVLDAIRKDGARVSLMPDGENFIPYIEVPGQRPTRVTFKLDEVADPVPAILTKNALYNQKGNPLDPEQFYKRTDGKHSVLALGRLGSIERQAAEAQIDSLIPDAIRKSDQPKGLKGFATLMLLGSTSKQSVFETVEKANSMISQLDPQVIQNNPLFKRKHLMMMAMSNKTDWDTESVKKLTMGINPFATEKEYKKVLHRMLVTGTLSPRELTVLKGEQPIWIPPEKDGLNIAIAKGKSLAAVHGIDLTETYRYLLSDIRPR